MSVVNIKEKFELFDMTSAFPPERGRLEALFVTRDATGYIMLLKLNPSLLFC